MDYVVAIDLGTSGCRSAVYDARLNLRAQSSVEIPIFKRSSLEVEQNPEDWWNGLVQTVREAAAAANVSREAIRAISISSQGISVVPVDANGLPLRNAISWLDSRPQRQMERLLRQYSFEELYRRTGKRANAIYSLPKYLWLMEEEPDVYKNTHKFLLPMDYLILKLCGRYCTDHTCAGGTMCYDIERQTWAEDLIQACGLRAQLFPEICASGAALGTLLPSVAAELGLSERTIVAMGAQDQKCASFGAGLDKASITVSLGTASCIEALVSRPVGDPQCRIPLFPYLFPEAWVLEGLLSSGCVCYDWFRDILGAQTSFADLDACILGAPAQDRPVFFYPYLSGESSPHWRENCGHFARLSLATTTGNMARSVLEGVAYALRSNLEAMKDMLPGSRELHLFGGGSRSPIFCQIISDVTNRGVLTYSDMETALAGAARLAFRGAGIAIEEQRRDMRRYVPNAESVARYDAWYADYEALRKRLFF